MMKTRILAGIAIAALMIMVSIHASAKTANEVKAAKGPIQITLRLHRTTIGVGKSLWYQLELKNVGKKKIRVDDWVFKDSWAMHHNCRNRRGIYLEIIGPDGKPLEVRRGGGQLTWDYTPKPGERASLTPEESKELAALRNDWNMRGLTEQQKSLALSAWNSKHHERKQAVELADPSRELWLRPGASTATFAWAYREPAPDEFTDHSGEEPRIEDYAQLWSYFFDDPGKYRVRAIYDEEISAGMRREAAQAGLKPSPWWVKVKTPFIEFQVRQ